MSFVLDCSTTMAWCIEDEQSDLAKHALNRLSNEHAVVPTIWPLEVANVMVIAERRRRLARERSDDFVSKLKNLTIVIDRTAPEQAFNAILDLARRHQLSAYDAAYLELALRLRLPLASLDFSLRKAALAAGVEVFKP